MDIKGNKMYYKERVFAVLHKYKYIIVLVAFLVDIGLLDENNLIHRYEHKKEISELKSEIIHYRKLYEIDTKRLNAMEKNPEEIKRIARESYFMKENDEDVFVFRKKE